jgi:hypothetical protein
MMGRKGWEQPTDATFSPSLSSDVTKCESGMYYNYSHSANSPIKIYKAQEDKTITEDNFNTYLMRLKRQVAVQSLTSVFRQNSPVEPPKLLFEKMYRSQLNTITNSDKFAGWQIKLPQGDYSVKIETVSLMLSGAADVTLYCFSDMRQDPIWTKEVSVTKGYDQQQFIVDDLYLTLQNNEFKGGIIYFGYFQKQIADQGVEALDILLQRWGSFYYIGYQGMEATSNYDELWFRRDLYYSNYRTYGLNLEISTARDYTNTVIRNAHAFDNLQDLIMTQLLIGLQMNSFRSNSDQRDSREAYELLYNEIEGLKGGEGIPYRQGLKDRIKYEVKRVMETFNPAKMPQNVIPPVNDGDMYLTETWGNRV